MIAASHNATIREYSTDSRHSVTIHRRQVEFPQYRQLGGEPDLEHHRAKTGYIAEAGSAW